MWYYSDPCIICGISVALVCGISVTLV